MPGSTEYTLRDSLITFLSAASAELEFGMVSVRPESRLKDVGQPDLQVVDGLGAPIGYAETKPLSSASAFAHILEGEQITRYRRSLENLLVTDFLRFTLFRADLGRLDVTLVATSAEQLAEGLARRTTLLRDAIRALLTTPGEDGEALRRLHEFYRRSLMSDMTDDDFADTYAQTLVYALFLARLEGGRNANWTARSLEHWLSDRRGRILDLAQIEQYQRAIHAVRESMRLEPLLDERLAEILQDPLDFEATVP